MKKIGTTSLFAVFLCAGCSQSNDNDKAQIDRAQIDAINQRLDQLAQNQSMIISNQMALSLEMNRQFASLPSLKGKNPLFDLYQTNSLAMLSQISSNVVASEQLSAAGFDYIVYGVSNAIAITEDLQSSVTQMQRDLSEMKSKLAR